MYLQPIQLLSAQKTIGKVEAAAGGKQFATFNLTIDGRPIRIQVKGVPASRFVQSQFNPNKLQLSINIQSNGELLFALTQLQKEIQVVLDHECQPDFEVAVQNIVKNDTLYLSVPRGKGGYNSIKVGEDAYTIGTDEFKEKVEAKLEALQGAGEIVANVNLYAWIKYSQDNSGKVTVGITPQLEEMVF